MQVQLLNWLIYTEETTNLIGPWVSIDDTEFTLRWELHVNSPVYLYTYLDDSEYDSNIDTARLISFITASNVKEQLIS